MQAEEARKLILQAHPESAIVYPFVKYKNGYVFNLVPDGTTDPSRFCDSQQIVNADGSIKEFNPIHYPDYNLDTVVFLDESLKEV